MSKGIVQSDDSGFLKVIIAVLVKKCGGSVLIAQTDLDAVQGLVLVDRFNFDADAVGLAVVERTDLRMPPGFGSVQ